MLVAQCFAHVEGGNLVMVKRNKRDHAKTSLAPRTATSHKYTIFLTMPPAYSVLTVICSSTLLLQNPVSQHKSPPEDPATFRILLSSRNMPVRRSTLSLNSVPASSRRARCDDGGPAIRRCTRFRTCTHVLRELCGVLSKLQYLWG
jgi:hypothetical protein